MNEKGAIIPLYQSKYRTPESKILHMPDIVLTLFVAIILSTVDIF